MLVWRGERFGCPASQQLKVSMPAQSLNETNSCGKGALLILVDNSITNPVIVIHTFFNVYSVVVEKALQLRSNVGNSGGRSNSFCLERPRFEGDHSNLILDFCRDRHIP
jgi:hypothetical protein